MSQNANALLLDKSNEEEETKEDGFFSQLPISNFLMNLYEPSRIRKVENRVDKYINEQTGLYRLGLNIAFLAIGTVFGLLYLAFTIMLIPMLSITMLFDMVIIGVLPKKEEENGTNSKPDSC